MHYQSHLQSLEGLWHHIPICRRRQFGALLALMVLAAFAEIISIGSVLPFLAVLTQPEKVMDSTILQPVIKYFHIQSGQELLLPLTLFWRRNPLSCSDADWLSASQY